MRIAKTWTELQGFFLTYPRKSQKVTLITFYCSYKASPDSKWEDTTHSHDYWELWIIGEPSWMLAIGAFGVTLLNRVWCDLN